MLFSMVYILAANLSGPSPLGCLSWRKSFLYRNNNRYLTTEHFTLSKTASFVSDIQFLILSFVSLWDLQYSSNLNNQAWYAVTVIDSSSIDFAIDFTDPPLFGMLTTGCAPRMRWFRAFRMWSFKPLGILHPHPLAPHCLSYARSLLLAILLHGS